MEIVVIAPTEIPARRANTLQAMKMAQALSILGHGVQLISPTARRQHIPSPGVMPSPDMMSKPGHDQYSWGGLAHHYGLHHKFPIQWMYAAPRLRRYDFSLRAVRWARSQNADLVYTRLPQAAAISSFLGMGTVLEIHDIPQGSFGPWLFQRFLKGRGARRLVVITKALVADLERQFGAPVSPPFTIIAPDGVDLIRYANLPSPEEARTALNQSSQGLSAHLPAHRFTAGYTGHLYPGRGVQLLLNLAARLPEVTFLIAGGDPQDVSHLKSQVSDKNLSNIILAGFVPNADLPGYQAACDVLLMPYQRQVAASSGGNIARYLSPMKLFEYLASQRAILSSDLPVLREILSPQNAVLLPYDDLDAWTTALKRVKDDPVLRDQLAAQARKDAGHFTWEARAARILDGLNNTT